ncbi:MAG: hypothetical protein ACFFCW_07175 [Candidatus Hodarchaeota archaeon]
MTITEFKLRAQKGDPSLASSEEHTYDLDPGRPIPLVEDLSYHYVSGLHLWIGIDKGVLVVFDDNEQEIFKKLVDGYSPLELLTQVISFPVRTDAIRTKRRLIRGIIFKLAEAGFIRDINGYLPISDLSPINNV